MDSLLIYTENFLEHLATGLIGVIIIFFSWLSENINAISTIVVAIATIILVRLTSRYVRLTGKMVKQMKLTQDPYVSVDLEFPSQEVRLAILNSGQTAAVNLNFHVLNDVPIFRRFSKNNKGLSTLNVIKRGIKYLPPGRILKFMVGYLLWDELKGKNLEPLLLSLTYENDEGEKFQQEILIDIYQYGGILHESFQDPGEKVAKVIENGERRKRLRNIYPTEMARVKMFEEMNKTECPVCKEDIPKEAKKCSHCHEWLENKETQKEEIPHSEQNRAKKEATSDKTGED